MEGGDVIDEIRHSVRQIMDEYRYPNTGVAFQHWVASEILGIDDIDKIAAEVHKNEARDGGID